MKKIPVENIEDEMILAKDITGVSGNALLGKGTKLTGAMGRRLKNWGVAIVFVEGTDDSLEESGKSNVSPEQNREILETRFKGVLTNIKMRDIFEAVLEFENSKE